MIIALASPRVASSLDDGLDKIKRFLSEASAQGAEIVCFPEAYLPGLRGQDFDVLPFDQTEQERVLEAVAQWARTYAVATILGHGKAHGGGPADCRLCHRRLGPDPGIPNQEPDSTRPKIRSMCPEIPGRLFEINGVKFGVAICHEGWRYPETVRWAAVRGAKIVFHPQHTGSDREGVRLTQWGAADCALLREGDDDAQHGEHDLLRQCQLCVALPGIGDEPHRPVGRSARRTYPMGRKACWCRPSMSRKRPVCWRLDTRRSGIRNPVGMTARSQPAADAVAPRGRGSGCITPCAEGGCPTGDFNSLSRPAEPAAR